MIYIKQTHRWLSLLNKGVMNVLEFRRLLFLQRNCLCTCFAFSVMWSEEVKELMSRMCAGPWGLSWQSCPSSSIRYYYLTSSQPKGQQLRNCCIIEFMGCAGLKPDLCFCVKSTALDEHWRVGYGVGWRHLCMTQMHRTTKRGWDAESTHRGDAAIGHVFGPQSRDCTRGRLSSLELFTWQQICVFSIHECCVGLVALRILVAVISSSHSPAKACGLVLQHKSTGKLASFSVFSSVTRIWGENGDKTCETKVFCCCTRGGSCLLRWQLDFSWKDTQTFWTDTADPGRGTRGWSECRCKHQQRWLIHSPSYTAVTNWSFFPQVTQSLHRSDFSCRQK